VKEREELFIKEDDYKKHKANAKTALEKTLEKKEKFLLEDYNEYLGSFLKTKDVKEIILMDSPLMAIRLSGLGGSKVNLQQALSMIGQSRYNNERLKPGITNKTRVTAYTDVDDVTIQSRGFITNNFTRGMNPNEMAYNLIGARQGLINTAISTATTGDLYSKLVRSMDNLKVQSNGAVTNSSGVIVQFEYSTDGMDASRFRPSRGRGMGKNSMHVPIFVEVGSLFADLNQRAERLEMLTA
jgi:DNA-directed RNA polymerase beta' subunit